MADLDVCELELNAHTPGVRATGTATGCISLQVLSLRSWWDFAHECFCFGREAANMSGQAVRGLVKSQVEFPLAQIR